MGATPAPPTPKPEPKPEPAPASMPYAQAISVAEGISSELTTIEQQQKALKQIKELLVKAYEADKLLKALDQEIALREESLKQLGPMLTAESAKARQEHQQLVDSLHKESEAAAAKLAELESSVRKADAELAKTQREHDRRMAVMNQEIEDREKHLRKLEEDFAKFKQTHNL